MAPLIVHATTVAIDGRGVMITGPSGCGKSSLALELMALGARLVADDRTVVDLRGGMLIATCPAPLRGMIEARGLGLLHAPAIENAQLSLCVDLSVMETVRLPERRSVTYLEHSVDLVHGQAGRHFPAALLQYVLHGRKD